MRRRILLALALFSSALGAQTTFDFASRFGPAASQRFSITGAITLTLQYGLLGTVCGVRLAPPDRLPNGNNVNDAMDSVEVTTALSEWLSPLGSPISKTVTKDGTNSFEVALYSAGTLSRSYIGSEAERTAEAALVAGPACLNVSRATVNARYGPAQYDSFAADPGLIVSVTYDSQHAVKRMEIVSSTPPVDRPAPSIDFSAADRLVAEVVPADRRGGMPASLEEVMGSNRVEQIQYRHVTISRHFADGDLNSVTVVWF